jgi:hypothetical protein
MGNRLIPTAITVFWLVMTGLLVRTEYFPRPAEPVPMEQVLDQVFTTENPTNRFSVLYRDSELGWLDLILGPSKNSPGLREVEVNSTLDLKPFGPDARLRLGPLRVTVDKQYNVQDFSLQSTFRPRKANDVTITLDGKGNDPKLRFSYTTGRAPGQRTISAEGEARTLVNAMVAELGLSQFGMINTFLNMASSGGGQGTSAMLPPPTVTSYRSSLTVQGVRQPMYVIEAKSSAELWTKAWISKSGQIVLVESSADLHLRNVEIYPSETAAARIESTPPGDN